MALHNQSEIAQSKRGTSRDQSAYVSPYKQDVNKKSPKKSSKKDKTTKKQQKIVEVRKVQEKTIEEPKVEKVE